MLSAAEAEISSRSTWPAFPTICLKMNFWAMNEERSPGAWHQKRGLLELADNGTLFLDELAETSLRVQVKLLRLLQERSFLRLGGTRVIRSNFRLVAATNRNLEQAVRRGRVPRRSLLPYPRHCSGYSSPAGTP